MLLTRITVYAFTVSFKHFTFNAQFTYQFNEMDDIPDTNEWNITFPSNLSIEDKITVTKCLENFQGDHTAESIKIVKPKNASSDYCAESY